MNYRNGIIKYNLIKDEAVLYITLSEEGTHLESHIEEILNQYKKYITTILFDNIKDNTDFANFCKGLKTNKLKIAVKNDSEISSRLSDLLDYIIKDNKVFKRDYCPFADAYDWIEIT